MRYFILTMCLIFFTARPCIAGNNAKRWVKDGNILYNKGEYEKALRQYEEALVDSPDSDIVNYDIGAALYKNENYEAAVNHFEKSLLSDDEELGQKASYNLGNAEYRVAVEKESESLEEAIRLVKQSLRHYERALEMEPDDEDAKHNYEFVKKELERREENAIDAG